MRGDADAQALAPYLVASEHSNMTALYRLPYSYIADDLGWPVKRVERAMAKLIKAGYIKYDRENKRVWVVEHARHEFGNGLELGDKRVKGIANALENHRISHLVNEFLAYYGVAFHLDMEALASPSEGASMGHRNQEQEQEQEQEQKQEQVDIVGPADRLRALREEIEWRIADTWAVHLKARGRFFSGENGSAPAPPELTDELRGHIRAAIKSHDAARLGADDRERWKRESPVRAAGIGLFLSSWHTGTDKRNDVSSGGKRYLEPWRPWRRQRDKPDPVPGFAELYFQEVAKAS